MDGLDDETQCRNSKLGCTTKYFSELDTEYKKNECIGKGRQREESRQVGRLETSVFTSRCLQEIAVSGLRSATLTPLDVKTPCGFCCTFAPPRRGNVLVRVYPIFRTGHPVAQLRECFSKNALSGLCSANIHLMVLKY